jgi:hypothetical protein
LNKKALVLLLALSTQLSSCEHSGEDVTKFTGEYRFYAGIAEFFICKERVKYYVGDAGISSDLEKAYLKQGVGEDDDVYMHVTGYLKEEATKVEGIDPPIVFIPVKLLKIDKERGCENIIQEGR